MIGPVAQDNQRAGQRCIRDDDEHNSKISVHARNPIEAAPTRRPGRDLSPNHEPGPVRVTPTVYLIWYGTGTIATIDTLGG